MEKRLENKKIAMIIAFRDFQDMEYFVSRDVFLEAGIEVVSVSSQKGMAIGFNGGEAEIGLTLEELSPKDFDAIVFIGGSGASKFIGNAEAERIANETIKNNKVLGAICIAPAILAVAGVLNGKKATIWSNALDKSAIKILKEEGAEYLAQPVVVDGKIITADGPSAAQYFAETIIKTL